MSASEDTLQVLYDRANLTGHFSQYIGHFSPLVGVSHWRMPDGDDNVCHELWIGIRRRTWEMERADLIAGYHFGQVNLFSKSVPNSAVIPVFPSETAHLGHGDMEQPVFVKVVEFPEHPKNRRKSWVRALVRLEPFDYAEFARSQLAEFGNSTLEDGRFVRDRERPFSRTWGRIRLCTEDGHGKDSVIQSAPEVVNGITGNQRPSLQGGRNNNLEGDPISGKIDVVFTNETVRLCVDPGRDFLLKGVDVVLGSTDFCPYG